MLDLNNVKEYYFDYDVTPLMDMKHFVMLLLADLAGKSIVSRDGYKMAILHTDFKQRIQDIMYEENGWGIKFSKLIPIETYYEHQQKWERKLGNMLSKVLKELGKDFNYIFGYDYIEIPFTEEEIENIKSEYDKETLSIMDHFTNLIKDYSFSRDWELDRKMMKRDMNRKRYLNYSLLVDVVRSKGVKNPEKHIGEFQPY